MNRSSSSWVADVAAISSIVLAATTFLVLQNPYSSAENNRENKQRDNDKIVQPERKKVIIPGIWNTGNTCFMNALLQADIQLRQATSDARKKILETIRDVLQSAIDEINHLENDPNYWAPDQDEDESKSSNNDNDDSSKTNLPPSPEPTKTNSGNTESNDFWNQYIPSMPDLKINMGDRRPGSLGGPCGRTSYRDFGPCRSRDLICQDLEETKPGLCEMKSDIVAHYSRQSALTALKLARAAIADIESASTEILLAASFENEPPLPESSESPYSEAALVLNSTDSVEGLLDFSPSRALAILLGFAVVGYFCLSSFGKRRAYRTIPGEGLASRA